MGVVGNLAATKPSCLRCMINNPVVKLVEYSYYSPAVFSDLFN
jgi:hypothetical protein